MDNCVFCKIVSGQIPAVCIWEDKKYKAILDINPNTEGMTVVLTKDHHDSYVVEMPEEEYKDFFGAARKVAKILEKGLSVQRVAIVMEGMGINHAHIKLYPIHGIKEKFQEMWANKKVYFEKYEGYISTQLGQSKTQDELKKVADKIDHSFEKLVI